KNKYQLIGFLDDSPDLKSIFNLPILGTIEEAKQIITDHQINEVIIAIPSGTQTLITRIMNIITPLNIPIKIIPGISDIIEGEANWQQIRNIEPEDLLGREEVNFEIEKIQTDYQNQTILVTGAGGSIGTEIIRNLLKLPVKKVFALGHGENSIHNLIVEFRNHKKFDYIIGDIRDANKISHEVGQYHPDVIFHAAAHKHLPLMEKYPDEAIKTNIIGTYQLIKAAIRNQVKKFILISTDKAVNPSSLYGASKRMAEILTIASNNLNNNTRFFLVRFGNVLGSRGSVIPAFKKQLQAGGPLLVTHPEIERYFMSIREAARLVIKAATLMENQIHILDMGRPIKIMEIAKALIKMYGYQEEEIPIKIIGLREGEKIQEELCQGKTQQTKFDKILIPEKIENYQYSQSELDNIIRDFKEIAEQYPDKHQFKALFKKYIPEYTG
ncbi:MAG: SDR family NAD(P)-dependent oxidoreductase, partial [Spirochaetes bacterium]|nr:SDR family NAD(P)-dependent oxidoreductase [Spirochaetota bacterium]